MDGRSIAGLQWNEGDDWEARAAHGARAGCRTAKGCGNGGNVRKRGAGTRGVDAVRAEPYGRAVRACRAGRARSARAREDRVRRACAARPCPGVLPCVREVR
ncbi:hypothetical protein Slala03_45920 [Streptomyces lavendulae subsp. lavendulae]|nr:hypothetical protein Slala03_45920 [Streptomyces lavendulae subsp. lavendulae]